MNVSRHGGLNQLFCCALAGSLVLLPCVAGCSTTGGEIKLETKGVTAAKYGVGTITVPTDGGKTVLLFLPESYGPDLSQLISEGPIGRIDITEIETAKTAAAAEYLQSIGLEAKAAFELAQRSSVSASLVSKRYINGGELVRLIDAKRVRPDVVAALKRQDARIVVEDYVVSGLTIEIERAWVADVKVQRTLDAAGIGAKAGSGSAYVLSAKAPVCTNADPMPCDRFAMVLQLDVDAKQRQRLADAAAIEEGQRAVNRLLNRKPINWSNKSKAEVEKAKAAMLKELNTLFPRFVNRNDEIVAAVFANDKLPK